MTIVGTVVYVVCEVVFVLLLARLVFDYVFVFARRWRPSGPIVLLLEAIYSVTDPPLKALRRVIPPLRLGGLSLDLGFLVLIIGVQIIANVVAPQL
ncbi:MAG: YggT family protein [Actinomycetes bacterium]